MATVTVENFLSLLDSLSSPNNDIRSAAEANYENFKSAQCESLVLMLISVSSDNKTPDHLRRLAIVLLRRVLISDEKNWYYTFSDYG